MGTYKITNITHLLGKREAKANSTLNIEYNDGLKKKSIKLEPNKTIYLTINTLPISVHRLRANNLVIVVPVGNEEINEAINPPKSNSILNGLKQEQVKSTPKPKNDEKKDVKKTTSGNKKR